MARVPAAAAADVAVVLVFALIGTANHATTARGLGHVALVALSFLLALAAGWLASRAWRAPARVWPTGVVVWLTTAALGVLLRWLLVPGAGVAPGFLVVTAAFLGVTLLGWRALATLAARRRAPA